MRVRIRLTAAAIGFLLPALALARWSASTAPNVASVRLPVLPEPIATWTLAAESQISAIEMAIVRPDAHLLRWYGAPDRSPMLLYVGLYGGRAGYDAGAHDPEVCYPAQGWQILGSRDVDVPLANGETLTAKLLDVHLGTERQAVLYWFQPAARWPATAAVDQFLRIFDAVAGRPQYAFVRLSAPAGGSTAEAERDLTDFAAQIAWPVREALGGSHETGPTQQGPGDPPPSAR